MSPGFLVRELSCFVSSFCIVFVDSVCLDYLVEWVLSISQFFDLLSCSVCSVLSLFQRFDFAEFFLSFPSSFSRVANWVVQAGVSLSSFRC